MLNADGGLPSPADSPVTPLVPPSPLVAPWSFRLCNPPTPGTSILSEPTSPLPPTTKKATAAPGLHHLQVHTSTPPTSESCKNTSHSGSSCFPDVASPNPTDGVNSSSASSVRNLSSLHEMEQPFEIQVSGLAMARVDSEDSSGYAIPIQHHPVKGQVEPGAKLVLVNPENGETHYEGLEVLSSGAQGTVYRAQEVRTQIPVAIKALNASQDPVVEEEKEKEANNNTADVTTDKEKEDVHFSSLKLSTCRKQPAAVLTKADEAEIQRMKALNHKNIVRLHEVVVPPPNVLELCTEINRKEYPGCKECEWDGTVPICYILQFANGGDLGKLKTEQRPCYELSRHLTSVCEQKRTSQLLEVMRQTSRGLAYIHEKGVIHYDIKPENILVHKPSGGGETLYLLTDFGISGLFSGSGKQLHRRKGKGTLHFVAPEAVRFVGKAKQEELQKVDVYALGVTFHILLTGGAFPSDDVNNQLGKDVDRKWHPLLKGMLHIDPKERFSVRMVRQMIFELRKGDEGHTRRTPVGFGEGEYHSESDSDVEESSSSKASWSGHSFFVASWASKPEDNATLTAIRNSFRSSQTPTATSPVLLGSVVASPIDE